MGKHAGGNTGSCGGWNLSTSVKLEIINKKPPDSTPAVFFGK
jgi:hypothetical protein